MITLRTILIGAVPKGISISRLSYLVTKRGGFYARGVNFYNLDGGIGTRHAEVDCVQRLKQCYKYKKLNMLVVRKTQKKPLANAKPCMHCVRTVYVVAHQRGYKIHRIYYSNEEGNFDYVRDVLT